MYAFWHLQVRFQSTKSLAVCCVCRQALSLLCFYLQPVQIKSAKSWGSLSCQVRTRLGPHLKWCSSSSSSSRRQRSSTLQVKKKETGKTNQTNKQRRHGLILASLSGLRICACVNVQCYHSRVLKFFQKSRVQAKMKHSRIVMSLRVVLGITHLELEIEANQKWKATPPHQAMICTSALVS